MRLQHLKNTQLRRPTLAERGAAPALIIGLVVLALVAFAVYWFVIRGGGASGATAKMAETFIPKDADMIAGIDPKKLLESDFIKQIAPAEQLAEMEKGIAELEAKGVKLDDIDGFLIAADNIASNEPSFVSVMSGNFDAEKLKGAMGAASMMAESQAGFKFDVSDLKTLNENTFLAGEGSLVGKTVALAGGTGESIASVKQISEVRSKVDTGAAIWASGEIPEGQRGMAKGMAKIPGVGDIGTPTHFAFSADPSSDLKLRGAVWLEGADADKIASSLDSMLSMAGSFAPEKFKGMIDTISISGSGNVLSGEITLDAATVKDLQSGRGMGLPF